MHRLLPKAPRHRPVALGRRDEDARVELQQAHPEHARHHRRLDDDALGDTLHERSGESPLRRRSADTAALPAVSPIAPPTATRPGFTPFGGFARPERTSGSGLATDSASRSRRLLRLSSFMLSSRIALSASRRAKPS